MVHGDNAGGCYHKLPSAEDPTKPWTENVRETEILATLEWGTCEEEECKYHMGDGQWEDVEAAFNNAFEENNPAAPRQRQQECFLSQRVHAPSRWQVFNMPGYMWFRVLLPVWDLHPLY